MRLRLLQKSTVSVERLVPGEALLVAVEGELALEAVSLERLLHLRLHVWRERYVATLHAVKLRCRDSCPQVIGHSDVVLPCQLVHRLAKASGVALGLC